jgi:Tol biopolymer transport system component
MTKKIKYLAILITVFFLFQFYKFVKIRTANLDLPKGKIVFSSPIDGDDEVYTMNVNGSNLKQLTRNSATLTNTGTDYQPSFSPDGKKIVFVSRRQGEEDRRLIYNERGKAIGEEFSGGFFDIFIMDSDGRNQIPLTYKEVTSNPFFSPDGEKIIFDTRLNNDRQIKMMNIDGSNGRILHIGTGGYKFSSDTERIFNTFQKDLGVMNLDGTNKVRLTQLFNSEKTKTYQGWNVEISNFEFSLDGKQVGIIVEEDRKIERADVIADYYNILNFCTMDIDGSELKEIYRIDGSDLNKLYMPNDSIVLTDLKALSGSIWQLKYAQDGKSIIFLADYTYKVGIYSLNFNNRIVTELTKGKEEWHGLNNFTFTPDGKKIIFIADLYPFGNSKIYGYMVFFHALKSNINYLFFKKQLAPYDNKYICVMDIDGKNFRKVAKLPAGTEIGLNSNFIYWEK